MMGSNGFSLPSIFEILAIEYSIKSLQKRVRLPDRVENANNLY